jgi:hypothetical protein
MASVIRHARAVALLSVTLLSLLSGSALAQTDVIVNGSFESPQLPCRHVEHFHVYRWVGPHELPD